MAMKNYRAPNGMTYQYEEGTQPNGYADVSEPGKKARTVRNKSRTAQDKSQEQRA